MAEGLMTTQPRLLDLPHGYQTSVSESDWPTIKDLTLYRGSNGYVYYSTWENGRSNPRTLHGLLMAAPKGTHVDHINGDKLDNRRENLRVVTPSINGGNRRGRPNKNGSSGVLGVTWMKSVGKWRAQIMVDRKGIHLGLFEDKDDAIAARQKAEERYF